VGQVVGTVVTAVVGAIVTATVGRVLAAVAGGAVTRVVGVIVPAVGSVVVGRMVNAWRGTPLAVHPTGIAILVVLLLPDRHSMFDFVDDVSACGEGFGAVTCTYTYPHCHVADREVSDAVYAGSVLDTKSGNRFRDDAFTFLDRERLERFIFEVADGEPFIMVANPTFERGITASGGIE
jgi:hypothetical protein